MTDEGDADEADGPDRSDAASDEPGRTGRAAEEGSPTATDDEATPATQDADGDSPEAPTADESVSSAAETSDPDTEETGVDGEASGADSASTATPSETSRRGEDRDAPVRETAADGDEAASSTRHAGPAESPPDSAQDGQSTDSHGSDAPQETADADVSRAAPATPDSEYAGESETESPAHRPGVPDDVRTYDRFQKIDGSTYERANDFLRERTYVTAREWAIARLCADFRTETGVEMTKIGEHLPELVPFMTDTYSPQAVNQARASFEEKVRKAGATFLYGAMSDFFTAEELDDVMYEATEVAKFLLEVEGVDLTVQEELEAEDTISEVMREVREHSAAIRHGEVSCPECGHQIHTEDA